MDLGGAGLGLRVQTIVGAERAEGRTPPCVVRGAKQRRQVRLPQSQKSRLQGRGHLLKGGCGALSSKGVGERGSEARS